MKRMISINKMQKNFKNININVNEITNSYLEIFIGPMFSGKTSKVLEIYKQCKYCNIDVMVINHSSDVRYDNHMLATHDKTMIPCHQLDKLIKIFNLPLVNDEYASSRLAYDKAKVILINEGQFFDDLEESVKKMLTNNKQIYICGLDGDFERKKFGQILDLIPLCDKVTKFTSLCALCKDGTPAIFSKRLTTEKEQTLIGSDNYLPVCRICYNK
jgi:thymidine kinase